MIILSHANKVLKKFLYFPLLMTGEQDLHNLVDAIIVS